MNAEYKSIINELRPGSSFYITENDYTSLIWFDENTTKPTHQEIIDKIVEYNTILANEILRGERNKRLIESDKYMIEDFPNMTNEKKELFKIYRQQLRDLPSTANPDINDDCELINVTWPTLPS